MERETGQSVHNAPRDFLTVHKGLFQYDAMLYDLATELFEETLERFPMCRAGAPPVPAYTTHKRDKVLTLAGLDPAEATACGWK